MGGKCLECRRDGKLYKLVPALGKLMVEDGRGVYGPENGEVRASGLNRRVTR